MKSLHRQDTLNSVTMHVSHLSYLKVTKSDPRKPWRGGVERVSEDEIQDDLDAVEVVICSEEFVQHEQLEDDVEKIQKLVCHVELDK